MTDEQQHEPEKYRMNVRIEITRVDAMHNHERLSIDETFSLGTSNFLQVAQILGRFHELANAIGNERREK